MRVELGLSALTRRDRLERIAAAERDRRAGRIELAIAVLGEGGEWPARIVLALAKLPEDEGAQTRAVLVRSLDVWAADSGLAPLDAPIGTSSEDPEIELGDLDSPLDHDELERAFAQAEAQTDEMHDVNRVAERVLMDESVSLAALAGDELVPTDDGPDETSEDFDVDGSLDESFSEHAASEAGAVEMDAAWVATSVWPRAGRFEGPSLEPGEGTRAEVVEAFDASGDVAEGQISRDVMLATLERWLVNLERSRAGRVQ